VVTDLRRVDPIVEPFSSEAKHFSIKLIACSLTVNGSLSSQTISIQWKLN
jgi:hypothetical protein